MENNVMADAETRKAVSWFLGLPEEVQDQIMKQNNSQSTTYLPLPPDDEDHRGMDSIGQ
jgi:hypothetical protein